MGVQGLWTVVHPSARPTNLSTLNRKRLAVDASIWIYQFLKAVRDKEGNVLRNSHVVGFFRRICKLLYHGIKPVFVFDGGAPALKRQTISNRKRRREGRREDAVRTAGKMLALQMQRRAEEDEQRRKDRETGRAQEEEELPAAQDLVYVDELGMSTKERQQNRTFRKKDAYHLPDLDISLEDMGAPNDPRIMSQHELEEYARQFHSGEDINLYDFSKIDFESPFFLSLPATDRYNILNAARLRSRLRMGYSKEQLDGMFPDRMAFSRFQIERVRERNELTQRLMHINGMNADDFLTQGARIAGEKGKEYVLVRNEGVEGGWALGVVSNKNEGRKEQPIDIETYGQQPKGEDRADDWEDEDGFEDIPIEGLNRLPKKWTRKGEEVDYDADFQDRVDEIARKREAVYGARKQKAQAPTDTDGGVSFQDMVSSQSKEDPESLFIPEAINGAHEDEDGMEELFEDVDISKGASDDEDLQRAIAMSLRRTAFSDDEQDFNGDAFNAKSAEAGREVARNINQRAQQPFTPDAVPEIAEDDEADEFDLQAALAESRKSKYQSQGPSRPGHHAGASDETPKSGFDGPLPFESINLGQSLLGKKKSEKIEQDLSGGFEKDLSKDKPAPQPLPPWFVGKAPTKDTIREPAAQREEDELYTQSTNQSRARIQRDEEREVIDVDAPSPMGKPEVIDVDADEKTELSSISPEEVADEDEEGLAVDTSLRMNDVADLVRAEPPITDIPDNKSRTSPELLDQVPVDGDEDHMEWSDTDEEELALKERSRKEHLETRSAPTVSEPVQEPEVPSALESSHKSLSDNRPDEDDDVEFEDVPEVNPVPILAQETSNMDYEQAPVVGPAEDSIDNAEAADNERDFEAAVGAQPSFDEEGEVYMSDSDDEIMRNLAIEAEEHARFAATLNNPLEPLPSSRPVHVDYEAELRQLRNQQKRDRRDADEVTQTMITECQMLLSHFGLPYITAPMEAEAQCAELVHLGLVDGIITDDSDVFLFGGTRIYKNMFNAAKFVECYLASDLEREYDLTRQKLISFAHLLGSDYTEGIPGVGPVTALEILTEFPEEEGGLSAFTEWWSRVQLTDFKSLNPETEPHYAFLKKFRKQLTKLFLPPHFPDRRVDEAYLHPEVDSDPSQFQWGVPDLSSLRQFLMSTIGWSQERMDEILVPVIRDMNRRELEGTQANITHFFGGGVGVGARQESRKQADKGLADPLGTGRGGVGRGNPTAATSRSVPAPDDENREVFAPRVRESDRMSRALGRLRGEAERKHKRATTSSDPAGAPATTASEATHSNSPDTHGSSVAGDHHPHPRKKKAINRTKNQSTTTTTANSSAVKNNTKRPRKGAAAAAATTRRTRTRRKPRKSDSESESDLDSADGDDDDDDEEDDDYV